MEDIKVAPTERGNHWSQSTNVQEPFQHWENFKKIFNYNPNVLPDSDNGAQDNNVLSDSDNGTPDNSE